MHTLKSGKGNVSDGIGIGVSSQPGRQLSADRGGNDPREWGMSARFTRFAVVIADVLCWAGAISSAVWEWPDMEWRGILLAAAIALLIVGRTSNGPSMRRTARVFYEQGVHDTLSKVHNAQPGGKDGTLRVG